MAKSNFKNLNYIGKTQLNKNNLHSKYSNSYDSFLNFFLYNFFSNFNPFCVNFYQINNHYISNQYLVRLYNNKGLSLMNYMEFYIYSYKILNKYLYVYNFFYIRKYNTLSSNFNKSISFIKILNKIYLNQFYRRFYLC